MKFFNVLFISFTVAISQKFPSKLPPCFDRGGPPLVDHHFHSVDVVVYPVESPSEWEGQIGGECGHFCKPTRPLGEKKTSKIRWIIPRKKGPLESDFQWLGGKMNSGIKFEKSLGSFALLFFRSFWERHPLDPSPLTCVDGGSAVSASAVPQDQTSTPTEGPAFLWCPSDKWFVFCIHIYIYRVRGWVYSIIFPCTRP